MERDNPTPAASPTVPPVVPTSPTGTVAPAEGPQIAVTYVRVRAPRGWRPGADTSGFGVMQAISRKEGWLSLSESKAAGLTSIDQAARVTLRESIDKYYLADKLRRADDVVLGGDTTGFHLVGTDGRYTKVDVVGTLRGDVVFVLAFVTDGSLSVTRRQEIVQSVSASWEFTV